MRVLFYDDGPTGHDFRAGAGDFQKSLRVAASAREIAVAVNLSTWHRLGKLLRFAAAIGGRSLPDAIPDFDPRRAAKLVPAFRSYLKSVAESLKGGDLALGGPDADLTQVLERFDAEPDTARPNLLRLLGVLSDAVFIGPHTFHLDISNLCNTNCTFCGLHSPLLIEPKNPMPGRRFTEGWKAMQRPWEEFVGLVDDLADLGTREDILFSGEGEPLTHPRIFDMIRYVCRKDMALTLFSNGILVNEKSSREFVESDLAILYWSLSAGSPETFAKLQPMHGPQTFTKMVQEVRRLVEKKKRRNNKPYIILAHVINSENYHECEKVMELAVHTGVDSVRYQIMHSCTSTESMLLTRGMLAEAKVQIDRARVLAERHGIEIVANIDFQLEQSEKTYAMNGPVLPCEWSRDLYDQSGCLAGWFFSRSFTDGMVSFCCHDKIVGTLKRGRFKDIWLGEKYRRARQTAKAFDPTANMDLSYGGCGGMLLGPDCASCGNYEFINQALRDLEALDWKKLVNR